MRCSMGEYSFVEGRVQRRERFVGGAGEESRVVPEGLPYLHFAASLLLKIFLKDSI